MTTLDLYLTVEVVDWDALDLWYLERELTAPADRLLYVLDRSSCTAFEFAPVTDPLISSGVEPVCDGPGDGDLLDRASLAARGRCHPAGRKS